MLHRFVQSSTQLTHTDPKAKFGALAVALAAYMAGAYKEEIAPDSYYEALSKLLNRESSEAVEFLMLMEQVADSVSRDGTTETFAEMQGLKNGISGYMYHTVPAVIHAWLANQNDFKSGITEIIRCGGDTDTTAAILGGIIGAHVGKEGIPVQWIDGIKEWPRTVWWIERLGKELAYVLSHGIRRYDLSLPWYGISLRNVFFLIIVFAHGFRRLLPPY
jgi:ADP-ribosylglycohydrolase